LSQGHGIVRSIIDLGHNLGLGVVAESVEDAATFERLRMLGCDRAQGYLFSRPVPGDALPTCLDAQPVETRR
jgi:EAL domain-containing protein (putative c-di-GMP-specific phosphodiesterase class I)